MKKILLFFFLNFFFINNSYSNEKNLFCLISKLELEKGELALIEYKRFAGKVISLKIDFDGTILYEASCDYKNQHMTKNQIQEVISESGEAEIKKIQLSVICGIAPSDIHEVRIDIPADCVTRVIGRKGANLKSIEERASVESK